jgi:nicotinamidase-related amidase
MLLRYFEASTLILCGISTESCIVCTAHDAKMRDFKLIVGSDCCAAKTQADHFAALTHIASTADARILTSGAIRLSRFA